MSKLYFVVNCPPSGVLTLGRQVEFSKVEFSGRVLASAHLRGGSVYLKVWVESCSAASGFAVASLTLSGVEIEYSAASVVPALRGLLRSVNAATAAVVAARPAPVVVPRKTS